MRSVGKGEDVGGVVRSSGIGHKRRARMTVLLLLRLAVAVLAILMCSWAMAIAWAAGTRGDADGLAEGPTFTLETPVQGMPEFCLEKRKAANTLYPQEGMALRWAR